MFKNAFLGLSKQPSFLVNQYVRQFAGFRGKFLDEFGYSNETSMDIYAKRFRKIILDRTIMAKDKVVVPAVRDRLPEDTLLKLRDQHFCAGLIKARDEFPDRDLVFENRSIYSIKNRRDCMIRPFHVQVGDEEIRCTLGDIQTHFMRNWLVNVEFNRYIVGRPNLINIPIKVKVNKNNMFLNKGSDLAIKMTGIWVYSYNEEYPTCFEVDPANISPTVGYRLGELVNLFPDGIELHPKYKPQLNHFLVEISETRDVQLKRTLEVMEYYRKLRTGELFDYDEKTYVDEEDGEEKPIEKAPPKERKKFKAKRKKAKSLKKIIATLDIKVKEGVVAATSAADGKKTSKKTEM